MSTTSITPDTRARTLAQFQDQAILIRSYTNLARALARRYTNRGEPAEDLQQVAMMALIKAAARFDPGRERPFAAFATACISGELKRHFRDKAWMVRVPRSVQEMHLEIRSARDELSQANGASPTIGEIADYLGASEEAVLHTMEAAANTWPASLDAASPDGTNPVIEIPVAEPGFEESINHEVLKKSISLLGPREQIILKRVFFEGRTQRQVAEELGVTQMHVSRILSKIIAKMRQAFQPA